MKPPSWILPGVLIGLLGTLSSLGTLLIEAQNPPPTTFDIGPGLTYPTISSFPWETLQPGNVVNIHGATYHEFLPLTASGTAAAPIAVQGVPGPLGEPVVLDGQGATIRTSDPMWSTQIQIRGLVIFTYRRSQPYGTMPNWITLSNIHVRNASPVYSFPAATGYYSATTQFSTSSAGIYIERGQNLVVSGCTISGCGDGLFVASNSDTTNAGVPASFSKNINVVNCTIRGNGVANSYLQHDCYSECNNIMYSGCTIGPPVKGSLGCALKDRSAGFVAKNCTITGGGHLIDSVEGQDSYALSIKLDPQAYAKRYITNCLLVNGPGQSTSPIFYGYDSIATQAPQGTLYVNGCTLLNTADQTVTPGFRWRTIVFTMSDNSEKVWVGNSIFVNASATRGNTPTLMEWVDQFGNLAFQPTFATSGWLQSRDNETVPVGTRFTGSVTGLNNILNIVNP